MPDLDFETQAHLRRVLNSALDKCKSSMENGPGGANANLTPEEATMIYRALVEVMHIPHPA